MYYKTEKNEDGEYTTIKSESPIDGEGGFTTLYCWHSETGEGDTFYFYTTHENGEGTCIAADSGMCDIHETSLPEDAERYPDGDYTLV